MRPLACFLYRWSLPFFDRPEAPPTACGRCSIALLLFPQPSTGLHPVIPHFRRLHSSSRGVNSLWVCVLSSIWGHYCPLSYRHGRVERSTGISFAHRSPCHLTSLPYSFSRLFRFAQMKFPACWRLAHLRSPLKQRGNFASFFLYLLLLL